MINLASVRGLVRVGRRTSEWLKPWLGEFFRAPQLSDLYLFLKLSWILLLPTFLGQIYASALRSHQFRVSVNLTLPIKPAEINDIGAASISEAFGQIVNDEIHRALEEVERTFGRWFPFFKYDVAVKNDVRLRIEDTASTIPTAVIYPLIKCTPIDGPDNVWLWPAQEERLIANKSAKSLGNIFGGYHCGVDPSHVPKKRFEKLEQIKLNLFGDIGIAVGWTAKSFYTAWVIFSLVVTIPAIHIATKTFREIWRWLRGESGGKR